MHAPKRPRIARKILLVVVAVVAGVAAARYGAYWWREGRFIETTDNAYVRADVTLLAPRVSGYVASIDVVENERVEAGQVLFRVDDRDFQARVSQSRADVAAREAALEGAKNQVQLQQAVIAQVEAESQSAAAEEDRAKRDLDRSSQLMRSSVVSMQTFDLTRANATKASAATTASLARIESERNRVSVLEAQIKAAEAALDQSRATLELAELDLSNTIVRAPTSGVIGNLQVRVGRFVQPGMQLLALVPLDATYVIANFKETQLDHMRIGQIVHLDVDTFPGQTVTAQIASFAPASGAQFALLPPDNATGNFTKVVQRIPVKILFDKANPLVGQLRPGMSVIASVDTRGGADEQTTTNARLSLR